GLLSRIDVGHGAANWEALAWRFVVTPTGAFPVASAMEAISAGTDVMYPEYEISQNGWHGGGGTRCGGDESSSGGDGTTAMIAFLDVCSGTGRRMGPSGGPLSASRHAQRTVGLRYHTSRSPRGTCRHSNSPG